MNIRGVLLAVAAASVLESVQGQATLESQIAAAESVVTSLAAAIEAKHTANTGLACGTCKVLNACGTQLPDTACNANFGLSSEHGCDCAGRAVNTARMAVHVHESTSAAAQQNFACATQGLDATMVTNFNNNPDLRYQQYGTHDGIYAQYPSASWRRDDQGQCATYDPRLRPWYIAGASGPKDVVIVIDTSGSMGASAGDGTRMDRAKDAAKVLINGLSFTDYAEVVWFNSDAGYSTGHLLQGTTENKCKLKQFVSELDDGGGTNFEAAFNAAFDVFANSASSASGCEKAIVFLTDGQANTPTSVINARKSGLTKKPHIFSYSFGGGASTSVPKTVSCENEGVWQHVDDNGDLSFAMGSYFQFFAGGLSSSDAEVRWSEPYESFSGLGPLATASLAVFDSSTTPKQFLGVAAVDVGMCDIFEKWGGSDAKATMLARSKKCATIGFEPCNMENLRFRAGGTASTCGTAGCSPSAATSGYSCTQVNWTPSDQGPLPATSFPAAGSACGAPCSDGNVCPNQCRSSEEQGYCDYSEGVCRCFDGFHGNDCGCEAGSTCAAVATTSAEFKSKPWAPTDPCSAPRSSYLASAAVAVSVAVSAVVAAAL